jgi:hypothetical protein
MFNRERVGLAFTYPVAILEKPSIANAIANTVMKRRVILGFRAKRLAPKS